MTSFFVAGVEPHGELAEEAAYLALRARSTILAGCPAKPRRIFKLNCRFHGSDCEIEVGRPLPEGGDVVLAILDHGRENAYVVYTDGDGVDESARVNRPVYAVTEFS